MSPAANENLTTSQDRPLELFFDDLDRSSGQTSSASAKQVADVVRQVRGTSAVPK